MTRFRDWVALRQVSRSLHVLPSIVRNRGDLFNSSQLSEKAELSEPLQAEIVSDDETQKAVQFFR